MAPDPLYLYLHSRQAAARARHAADARAFVVFINIGGGLIHVSLDRPLHYPILCGALLAALGFLRRARLSNSGGVPLAFEDTLPDDVNVIPWS